MSAGSKVQKFLEKVCHGYPRHSRYLLAAMEDVQAYYGFIPDAVVSVLSESFKVSRASVQQWLDRPGLFQVQLPGRYVLKICCGPICADQGGKRLLASMEKLPGCSDGDISLLASPCLGSCNQAPVAKLNNQCFVHADETTLRDRLVDPTHPVTDADGVS